MAEAGVRIALLARAGDAREQLRRALIELGAQLVAEGDPNELDPATVMSQQPKVVVISLEPAIEDAIDRFSDLLGQQDVDVVFDDADVTRQLEGWDLNRWARHLAGKLLGRDVLPPIPQDSEAMPEADMTPVPGAPPTPAQLMDQARLEDYTLDTRDMAANVPADANVAPATAETESSPADNTDDDAALGVDPGDIEKAMSQLQFAGDATASTRMAAPEAETAPEADFNLDVDLDKLGKMLDSGDAAPADGDFTMAEGEGFEGALADFSFDSDKPVKFSSFDSADEGPSGALDDDVAALAAQLDALEKSGTREEPRDPDFSRVVEDDGEPAAESKPEPARAAPAAARPAEKGPSLDFSKLSLTDMEAPIPKEPAPVKSNPTPVARSGGTLGGLNLSLEPMDEGGAPARPSTPPPVKAPPVSHDTVAFTLEAVEDAAPVATSAGTYGALLILAGMGGPDAVRQLLGQLPASMPVPVLLYQHLEVGKHDRLVGQLAKVSKLPVYLAIEGKTARPGELAVLPNGVGIFAGGGEIRFAPVASQSALVAALPPADSVVIVLSGSDPSVVSTAMAVQAAGGLALAQEPAGCFDSAAAEAMRQAGAAVSTPTDLAQQAAARWAR